MRRTGSAVDTITNYFLIESHCKDDNLLRFFMNG